ncbi:hypothetical protein [Nocardia sp. bgisy118]|uniref:hypothetical protein n=1 Tax=Nocardia sp. bgisy118 TaxID=3413786 RepID=UPI003F49CD7A
MMRELGQDELIDRWTWLGKEPELDATKRGATKLGFGLMLRFYTKRSRFPRARAEIADAAVDYVARQVDVERNEMRSTTSPAVPASAPGQAVVWSGGDYPDLYDMR